MDGSGFFFKMPKARGPEDEEALAEGTFLLKRLEQEVAKKGGNKDNQTSPGTIDRLNNRENTKTQMPTSKN